ncbi:ferrochelatase [Bdellovibrio bacteriovorus]|uniref:Ferrochelatase n=1 Tax=Bdellovibrio bacteriovorus (strain ATCC 15356 / DSM 50701 / NCIMB 9529 / HD100) TaxID=264462 RepID=HEMH_BDEBA|nr:ferrochelatase [Bdellovibrio bacteriovorus]Q6MHT3.1 RecName: Full=Ferrochelatase; AltName: Full=Heme synthase; AltName: Full=Protoheme ferro-lyase [Bdellovibrio bacteriovorus HD100]CAE78249.1 Ferrochelatase [Bdellovibrio bacteriovorus HD100]
MGKKGLLLINIGSPKSYQVNDVKKYLSEFLMDEDVITLPYVLRWPLVNLLIVPRRAPFSAENYKKVWMKEGSPIAVYTRRFAALLQEELKDQFVVKVGLQYSEPSVESALKDLQQAGVDEILVAPMFPQYAEATNGSSFKLAERMAKKLHLTAPLRRLPAFFDDASFVGTSVKLVEETLQDKEVDHYLFSFHGLPESHVRKIPGCLTTEDCCFEKNACAKNCYRAQCFATATAIAESLNLAPSHWSVAFQSRLGRAEWLKPATDHSLEVLAKTGKKNIAVICPSFVADCIETLEEIGIGGQETFHEHGGDQYYLVPCVNDNPKWVQGFADLVKSI